MRTGKICLILMSVVLVFLVLVEGVFGEIDFEFWDTVSHEAFTRCELKPASGSAQLSEDYMWPEANAGWVDLECFAELGDEFDPLKDWALAGVAIRGDAFDWEDGYGISILNEGIVSTDLKNAGEIKSEVEGYFLLAMYVPKGEAYEYTVDFVEMETYLDLGVDFDDSAWHVTLNGDYGFSSPHGDLYVGKTGFLIGKDDYYLLYGGFKFSATDTTADSVGIYGEVIENVEITVTAISNFKEFVSFADTWGLSYGQDGYDDQWDLVDDGVIDMCDFAEFCSGWLN